jgi:predicted MFS family arabinose efflux permease
MAAFGIGSVAGAMIYARCPVRVRNRLVNVPAPIMLAGLLTVAIWPKYGALCAAWWVIGAGYSILGIRGRELLAANSSGEEHAHLYAAHLALSHAGWGLTYPLAGWLTSTQGFVPTAWIFAGILLVISLGVWSRQSKVNNETPAAPLDKS